MPRAGSPRRSRDRVSAPARFTVGPRTSSSTVTSSPVAMPIRRCKPSGRTESARCNATAARTAFTALGNVAIVVSPSAVAPRRRPPCSSTLRSIASCMSARRAGTRCGVRSHNSVDPTTSVSITVPTPVGVSSSQPARKRSTRTPGDAGRRAGSIDKAERSAALESRGDVARDSVPHRDPTRRRFAGQERERGRAQAEHVGGARRHRSTGDLRRAEARSAAAGGVRHGNRRRAEVDDHDPTGAVDDQVGRFDVAVYDAVPVQERQYLGGLRGPPQHTRDRETRATCLREHAREVHPFDPVEHEDVAATIEQVVARVREPGMRRQREQRAGFDEQRFRRLARWHRTDLQRDEAIVAGVDGLDDRRLAAPPRTSIGSYRSAIRCSSIGISEIGERDDARVERGVGQA